MRVIPGGLARLHAHVENAEGRRLEDHAVVRLVVTGATFSCPCTTAAANHASASPDGG
jgi:hypothetical protein